jgi:formylglycine-generating enzyme required for sulfatase activity
MIPVTAVGLLFAPPAVAAKRVALVIGNSAYQHSIRLPNPRNDADDVATALKRLGFETILGLDLDKAKMEDATIRFNRAARAAEVAMFYYSGHAMQHGGVNYLMPIDAKLIDEADLRRLVRLDDIVADLQQAKNLRILVLDSCRDNPIAEELKRSIGATRSATISRGIARIDSPLGMIVAYATQAGRTAQDGKGRNSPYTTAFLKHVEAQEEIGTVFRRVSAEVYAATSQAQLPELSLSVIGEFYLKDRPPAAAVSASRAKIAEEGKPDFKRAEEERKTAAVVPAAVPVAPTATPPKPAVGVFPELRGAKPLSPAQARALKAKDSFKECDNCPEMVVVPAGSFRMGSPPGEKDRRAAEGPQHRVSFARPFAVGKYAVRFDEWDACVGDGGCNGYRPADQGWGRGSRPVINVTWEDAKAYVAWLSKKTGKTYRLLSEAEREYVTRAGTTTPYWTGIAIARTQANFDNSTVPVDSFAANPWGLYQVHGNVWEWTEDCWNDSYRGAPTDGSAWISGDCGRRVYRGGGYEVSDNPTVLRAAFRIKSSPGFRASFIGFRVARTIGPPRSRGPERGVAGRFSPFERFQTRR